MGNRIRVAAYALTIWSIALPVFAEDGEHHSFLSIFRHPFIWGQVVNFLLLLFLFWKFALPALNKYFAERRNNIAEDLDEATRLKQEAEETFAQYESKLAELDKELATLRTDVIKAGEVERDRIVGEAEGKAARLRKDNQFIIDQRGKQLRLDLRREAAESTIEAARRSLQERLTAEDHRRLAEEFLKELTGEGATRAKSTAAGAQPPRGLV